MVQIYVNLIKMGLRIIEQVPLTIRGEVEDALAKA